MLTQARLKELLSYHRGTGQFRWRAARGRRPAGAVAGCVSRDGYLLIRIDGVQYRANRLAWLYIHGEWPKEVIDHRNGRRANNRIGNLRDVSLKLNAENRRKAMGHKKRGRLLGAYWRPERRCWVARIEVDGKRRQLGSFRTERQAHRAYVAAKQALHAGCTL